MLVLLRKVGQSIVIGKNAEITIKVLSEKNGDVRIGIEAPKSISVDRLEVFKRQILASEKKETDHA